MAEKTEKTTASAKLNGFLDKNRKPVLITFIVVLVLVIAFVSTVIAISSASKKDLAAVENFYYEMMDSSNSLEDAIRNCVAIGGDCDTTAAMAGAIAEAYYQKDNLSKFEEDFLYYMIDPHVEKLVKDFHKTIGSKKFTK